MGGGKKVNEKSEQTLKSYKKMTVDFVFRFALGLSLFIYRF